MKKKSPRNGRDILRSADILVRFGAREPQADKNVRAPPIEI